MNDFDFLNEVPDVERDAVERRLAKAKDSRTSPIELKALSRDAHWFIRNFVACNPGTPAGTLADLLCDPDTRVVETAQKTLERTDMSFSDYKLPLMGQIHAAEIRRKTLEKDVMSKGIDGPSL